MLVIILSLFVSLSSETLHEPGEIIVKFRTELRGNIFFSINNRQFVTGYNSLDEIFQEYGIYDREKIIKRYDFNRENDYGLDLIYVLKMYRDNLLHQAVEELERNSLIEYVSPNYTREIYSSVCQDITGWEPLLHPNDPNYNQQWFLPNISAEQAWDIQTGSHSKKVCVIDVGIDWDHEDLYANWITGYDFYDNDPDPDPGVWSFIEQHGTHCSGCAAGVSNNSTGIASIGYGIGLIGVRAGFLILIDDAAAIQGIYYACTTDADVISMSFGGTDPNQAMQDAINEAYINYDIIVIAAAGNDDNNTLHYPACCDNVIAVAATDDNNTKASFSCYGSWIDISAPGVSIYATLPDNAYAAMDGTSMACPVTAGLVTLIRCQYPTETNYQIIQRLYNSADSMPGEPLYLSGDMGAGKINAYKAISGSSGIEEITGDNINFNIRASGQFSPIPSVYFSSPEEVNLDLVVYDIMGRRIDNLFNGSFTGERNFQFNTQSSGIYTYYANVNERIITGKLIVLK